MCAKKLESRAEHRCRVETSVSFFDRNRLHSYAEEMSMYAFDLHRRILEEGLDLYAAKIEKGNPSDDTIMSRMNRDVRNLNAKMSTLSDYKKTHSEEEFLDRLDDLGTTLEEFFIYGEEEEVGSLSTKKLCECFVTGVLSVTKEMDSSELKDRCVAAGYSRALAKQAIEVVSDYRKDDRKSIRFLKPKL